MEINQEATERIYGRIEWWRQKRGRQLPATIDALAVETGLPIREVRQVLSNLRKSFQHGNVVVFHQDTNRTGRYSEVPIEFLSDPMLAEDLTKALKKYV